MIRQVVGTIATRSAGMLLGLLVTVLAGHRLGAQGLGTIGLVILGITLVSLLASTLGSGVLTYLVPRVPLPRLLPAAYLWAAGACALGGVLLHLLALVPEGMVMHVALLAFLQALYSIHFGVLLGQQRIKVYNTIVVVQSLIMLVVFAVMILRPGATAMAYVEAAYVAHAISAVASAAAMRNGPPPIRTLGRTPLRTMFRQGGIIQVSNTLQLLNYRFVYWLIERSFGTAVLGSYTVANQLAEGSWLAPKSLGTVLYSRMSNTEDAVEQREVTLLVLKMAMAFATSLAGMLLLLPESTFAWAFGPEVAGVRGVLLLLAPGILAMSAAQAFGHYFSGTGRNLHNMISSGLGLAVTLSVGLWVVPRYGPQGAAFTASCAYLVGTLYMMAVFLRTTGTPFRRLWPDGGDLDRAGTLMRRLSRRSAT